MVRLVIEHGYDSRLRTTFRGIAGSMEVSWRQVGEVEQALGHYLHQKLGVFQAQLRDRKYKRYAATASAAVVGGAVMALTASTAAPLLGMVAGSGIWGANAIAGH